ncbi:hypothetical protein O988_01119 [Pseudogymnoascus sp. VKM F-3808]|nr:hypothetical protein O988_01119 [Pseudogymnoascus sp. VKM F-3808]
MVQTSCALGNGLQAAERHRRAIQPYSATLNTRSRTILGRKAPWSFSTQIHQDGNPPPSLASHYGAKKFLTQHGSLIYTLLRLQRDYQRPGYGGQAQIV